MSKSELEEFLEIYKDGGFCLRQLEKITKKLTKEDYLKILNTPFIHRYDKDNAIEIKFETIELILSQLEDFVDIDDYEYIPSLLVDFLIRNLKQECNELTIYLTKKFGCCYDYKFDFNEFVLPTLEGLLNFMEECSFHGSFLDYAKEIIFFLRIHGADFNTAEAKLLIDKFTMDEYKIITDLINSKTLCYFCA